MKKFLFVILFIFGNLNLNAQSLDVIAKNPGCNGILNDGVLEIEVISTSSYSVTVNGTLKFFGSGNTSSFPLIHIDSQLTAGTYTITLTDSNNVVVTDSAVLTHLPQLSTSLSITNPTCQNADGMISVITSGGTGPYVYIFDGTISSLPVYSGIFSGTYFVAVIDSNLCLVQDSITLVDVGIDIQSSVIGLIADTCNQSTGAFCISPSSGTAPFLYTVDGLVSSSCPLGLNAGLHNVTITDFAGCISSDDVVVPNYSTFTVAATIQDNWCTQGDATITTNIIGSASSPIVYNNSYNSSNTTSITTNTGGIFTFTAVDASGCSASIIASTNKRDSLKAFWRLGTGCFDTLMLGSAPYQSTTINYSSYPQMSSINLSDQNLNFVIPAVATYTFVANTPGFYCNDTTFITLLPNAPSTTVLSTSNINPNCLNATNGSITAVANPFESNAIYSLINTNNTLLQQSTSPIFSNLGSGTYSISVRDSSGCNQISTTLTSLNSNCGNISGHVVIDTNSNCNFDIGELTKANRMVVLNPGNHITYTNASGAYVFPSLSYGNYTIQTNAAPGYIPICSATSAAVVSNTNANIIINRYDSIAPLVNYSIWSWGGCLSPALAVWNPNFLKCNINYSLYYTPNIGGTARLYAVFDSVQYFGSSLPTHSGINGDTVYWDLPIGSNGNIEVTFSYPPNTQAGPGQNVNYYVTQHPLDSNLANNFSPTTITICTSYDPNDKQVNPEGATSNGFTALNDSVLNYKVRFQNTGNAPAGNVIIRDTLDSDLDITSFSVISASHSYQIEVEQNHILVFKFLGIMLPDSASDQEGSNGYIAYTIKKKPGTMPGDIVSNTAHIYFDYNAPIVTNTTTNTYYESIKNASTQITKNTNCSNVCGNGSVLINAQGGAGTLTYSILPNCASTQVSGNLIAPLPSGNFTVQVKDQAGNIENLPITIGSPTPINLSINTTNASGANGGSAQANVSGGTTPYTYNWSASGCSGATCNNLNVGTYTLSILDAEGCSTSSNFTISYPTSVQQINLENSIQLFPNPTKDILFVTGTNNLGLLTISNQMGQIIWSANLNTNETQISTSGWANGVYYLRNGGRVYKVSVQD